jgi:hypothetical protein
MRYEYRFKPAPDSVVFDWDDATLQSEENKSSTPNIPMDRASRKQYAEDVNAKQALIVVRRVQKRLIDNGKTSEAALLRKLALNEVRRIEGVKRRCDHRQSLAFAITLPVALLVSMLGAFLVSLWTNSHRDGWLFLLAPLELAAVLALIVRYEPEDPSDKRWPLIGKLSSVVVTGCLAAVVVVGIGYRNKKPNLVLEFAAGVGATLLLFTAGLVLGVILMTRFDYQGQGIEPRTVLIFDLISLIDMSMQWGADPDETYELVTEFEHAARRAERVFRRDVPFYPQLRQWARYRGRHIAAVLREHEQKLMETSAAGRTAITLSLLNGLQYVIREDWQSFLVVEPERPRKTLIRRYAPRVALSLLLIGLAFLLPKILPTVIKDPISFQATVLLAAGFSLLAPDVQKAAEAVRSFGSR